MTTRTPGAYTAPSLGALVRARRRSGSATEVVFHLALLLVGLLNLLILARRAQDDRLLTLAPTESWFTVAMVGLWLVPSVYYLRTWAGAATTSTLWMRAPLVQFVGILVAASGAAAALLRLLAALVIRVAQAGVAVSVEPPPARVTVGMVHSQLVWDAVDTVPLLGIPGTLGWERPVADPDWPLGWAGVTAHVAVAVWVLWTFGYLVARMRLSLLPRLGTDASPTTRAPRRSSRTPAPWRLRSRSAQASGERSAADRAPPG